MHAIIETGGKQYRVAAGDVIRVEKLAGDVGSEIELNALARFQDGGQLVSGGTVKATILDNDRGPKIIVFKFKRKKLRATAVRRPIRVGAATADYGDLAEPSMKLSRALLIVLLLHVVAVAGIIAFNAIKTRQGSLPSPSTTTMIGVQPAETKPQTTAPNPATWR